MSLCTVWTWRGELTRIISARGREMRKSGRIVRSTQNEVEDRIARGENRTDWARVDAMSEAELEAAVASDPDADAAPIDPFCTYADVPGPKEEPA